MVLMSDASAPEEGVVLAKPPSCPCDSCKMERFEPNKLKNAVIHQYSYQPNWRKHRVKNDPYSYYLGVELETDSHFTHTRETTPFERSFYGATMREEVYSPVGGPIAADMRRPKNLWITKTDSSITGPEFVSHPATLAFWHSRKRQLGEMFTMLLHAGYRSHDNDKCGMHVNISRNAFKDANHLYRFLTLLHYSPAWSLRMSQRTLESMQHWAPLNGLERAVWRKSRARDAFSMSSWRAVTDKYSALNMPPAEQGRFEFRLPRGTLRIDRFFKNLEWTVAMIEFTRTSKVSTSRPIPFMKYVMENKSLYPYLAKFIDERGARLEKAVYRPRTKTKPRAPRRVNPWDGTPIYGTMGSRYQIYRLPNGRTSIHYLQAGE